MDYSLNVFKGTKIKYIMWHENMSGFFINVLNFKSVEISEFVKLGKFLHDFPSKRRKSREKRTLKKF